MNGIERRRALHLVKPRQGEGMDGPDASGNWEGAEIEMGTLGLGGARRLR